MRVLKKNHGMFLETIIMNSINYYHSKKVALFRKLEIPIKIIQINDFEVHGLLRQKADVDFYGIYKSKFYCIEAKQTNENYFYTKNLKIHQIQFLNKIYFLNGSAILIIHFNKDNLYFKINWTPYWTILFTLKKQFKQNWFLKYARKLELIFPGWIDFLELYSFI